MSGWTSTVKEGALNAVASFLPLYATGIVPLTCLHAPWTVGESGTVGAALHYWPSPLPLPVP